jgi:uncharacterized FlgJ-related protein
VTVQELKLEISRKRVRELLRRMRIDRDERKRMIHAMQEMIDEEDKSIRADLAYSVKAITKERWQNSHG